MESAYSFKGSNITLDAFFAHALKSGWEYVVLTDYTMHGAYKFYTRAIHEGLKPVMGLKVNIEPHFSDLPLHGFFYAQNEKGYKNLLKLASLQSVNGLLTYDGLKAHTSHLTFVLDATFGEYHVLSEENAKKTLVETLKKTLKTVYTNIEDPSANLPLLPVYNVKYLRKSDKIVCETLLAILKAGTQDEQEMFSLEENALEESKGVQKFLDDHTLRLSLQEASLPVYPTQNDVSSDRYLRALSHKGLKKRLNGRNVDQQVYEARLEKELTTIHELGYDDYFLIIWDVIKYAKSANILVGPGRGSAPGSLVSYALGITSIDPIEHQLLFERFLNKARKTMPDIDIDFPDTKRDEVVRYVKDKYGSQYVALICTFGTFLSKSALRDSARVLKIESKYVEEMAKKVNDYDSIADMIAKDPDVKNRMNTYENIGKWLNIAKKIEGIPRHVSTHAAGVMLSEVPLIEYTALQEGLNTLYQTQYEQSDLEAMGLLKMDFLGLKNLSMIENVIEMVEADTGTFIDLHKLSLQDEKTFEMLRDKSTTGIFQLESAGMRRLIKKMQISSFNDVAVVLALYRPGPMESIPTFLERRFKKASFQSIAPEVDPILQDTQGILLYQEQIMEIATKFAGYSLNEADILRRAVSKKDAQILEAERKNFVRNAVKNNKTESKANEIYDYIVKFANYGFNKSHSVAYGLVAYWMAYLKANYPQYFIAVLMQNALNNESVMRSYMQEVNDHNLVLNGPSVVKSADKFIMKHHILYFPLIGIKTVGKRTVKAFLSIKNKAMFASYADFIKETKQVFTSRNYEYLIASGAMDCFKINKRTMTENLKPLINFIEYDQALPLNEFIFNELEEYDNATLKKMERDALGFNIAYDALQPYVELAKKHNWAFPANLEQLKLQQNISMIGVLKDFRVITTKKQQKMAFLTIEDKANELDGVLFPNGYRALQFPLVKGEVFLYHGKVNLKEGKRQFIVESIEKVLV